MIWYVIIEREIYRGGVHSLTFKEKAYSLVHAIELAQAEFDMLFKSRIGSQVVEAGRWPNGSSK